jgi:hypothetical protein
MWRSAELGQATERHREFFPERRLNRTLRDLPLPSHGDRLRRDRRLRF